MAGKTPSVLSCHQFDPPSLESGDSFTQRPLRSSRHSTPLVHSGCPVPRSPLGCAPCCTPGGPPGCPLLRPSCFPKRECWPGAVEFGAPARVVSCPCGGGV